MPLARAGFAGTEGGPTSGGQVRQNGWRANKIPLKNRGGQLRGGGRVRENERGGQRHRGRDQRHRGGRYKYTLIQNPLDPFLPAHLPIPRHSSGGHPGPHLSTHSQPGIVVCSPAATGQGGAQCCSQQFGQRAQEAGCLGLPWSASMATGASQPKRGGGAGGVDHPAAPDSPPPGIVCLLTK